MRYELKLMDTLSGTGCFAAFPGPNLSFSEVLAYLEEHPFDEFMHRHMLDMLGKHRTRKIQKLIKEIKGDPKKRFLPPSFMKQLLPIPALPLYALNPTLHLRSHLLEDQPLHNKWTGIFSDNMEMHEELPTIEETGIEQLYKPEELPSKDFTTASTIREKLGNESKLPPAKERA
ncbi:YcaO-like family protein, partial [Aduncisulcus paluster]